MMMEVMMEEMSEDMKRQMRMKSPRYKGEMAKDGVDVPYKKEAMPTMEPKGMDYEIEIEIEKKED